MGATRFDHLTRLIVVPTSRRQTVAAIVLGALSIHELRADVEAGPGCRNVGTPCQNASQYCSNVCARVGKKGKKPK